MISGVKNLSLAVAGLCLTALPVSAEVIKPTASGFTIQHVRQVNLTPQAAWARFMAIGSWWASSHTWSGSSQNLSLSSKAGSCFCEHWSGGEVEHLRVVFAEPGKRLHMAGALGPLQMTGLSGNMTITFTAKGEGTEVTLRYAVAGHAEPDLATWSGAVDRVLEEQLTRFQNAPVEGQAQ